MSQHAESAEAMYVVESHAHQSAVDLRFSELNGKVQRGVQDGIEIVCSQRELPKISCSDAEFTSELLLETNVKLIAPGRSKRLYLGCSKRTVREASGAGRA